MRRSKKRIIALLVTLCMIMALIPLAAVPVLAASTSTRTTIRDRIEDRLDRIDDALDSVTDRLMPSRIKPSPSPSPSETTDPEESPDPSETVPPSAEPKPTETVAPTPSTPADSLPFTDVKKDDYYYDAVSWAVGKTITAGTSPTTFGPDDSCTRAQVMTFLWRANGSPRVIIRNNPFKDVKSDSFYYDAVLWAVSKGITSGTSTDTFSPDESCTRAQVVTFLWRAKNTPDIGEDKLTFTDVPDDAYYHDPVCWAVNNVVTAGTSETTFSPNDECTRSQVMVFLWRAYK